MEEDSSSHQPAVDGRSARWATHRRERRHELTAATLRAIRAHGAGVGMDEIAAAAGTSKTVIYRHFGDRTGLFQAVVERVHQYILTNLRGALDGDATDPAALAGGLADSYLQLVQRDPEIYRFVVTRPLADDPVDDPVASFTAHIGDELARTLAVHLERAGRATGPATTWGHGVVGFLWAVADQWLASGLERPREEIVASVEALLRPAFAAVSAPLEPAGTDTPHSHP